MKRLFFLIIVSLFFVQCGKNGRVEVEPNDSYLKSEFIKIGVPILGFINSKKDIDVYRFKVNRKKAIQVNLSGVKGVNIAFKLIKEENVKKILKIVDDHRKSSPEELGSFVLSKGVYYVVILHGSRDVKKGNIESPYNLKISEVEVSNFELEPNDIKENANLIKINNFVTGMFSPGYNKENLNLSSKYREEDWFCFDVNLIDDNPQIVTISLSKVLGINSFLELYDSDGKLISKSDKQNQNNDESIDKVGLKKSGRYYILVSSHGYNSNIHEKYTLNLVSSEFDINGELEPNDTSLSANNIVYNHISGMLADNDVDYFIYKNNQQIKSFKVVFKSEMPSSFTIFDSENNELSKFETSVEQKEIIFPNLNVDKFSIFKVNSENMNFSYSLSINPVEIPDLNDIEPNNNKKNGYEINSNKIKGFTSYFGDKDYYIKNIKTREKHKILIFAPLNGEIKVSITDPLGYVIKSIRAKNGETKSFFEMIDLKTYIVIESISEDLENPYIVLLEQEKL